MNDNHQIIWEKWRDPFLGYDENDIDIDNIVSSSINDDYYDGEDEEEKVDNTNQKNNFIRAIATPMGIIPYNEYTASGKIFNFWIGHTNFNITKEIAKTIETTDGIETLDIFTRYRFRIAIGKAFEDRNIMKLVDERIKELLYEPRRT